METSWIGNVPRLETNAHQLGTISTMDCYAEGGAVGGEADGPGVVAQQVRPLFKILASQWRVSLSPGCLASNLAFH